MLARTCSIIILAAISAAPTNIARAREAEAASSAAQPPALADKPLEAHRLELLDLAFEAASAIPIDPHIKTRSRQQEAVVVACLELGQASRADRFIGQIVNWRRGTACADYAFHAVRQGAPLDSVATYLARAEAIANEVEDWRRDRIRAKIARVHLIAGDFEGAAAVADALEPSELRHLSDAEALAADAGSLDEQLRMLGVLAASGDFDLTRAALDGYARLYERFFQYADRRAELEKLVHEGWSAVPYGVRIDVLATLAETALAHGDRSRALGFVEEAQVFIDGGRSSAEFRIPVVARLAALRFRAGDAARARHDLAATAAQYDAELRTIINIQRADVLRPIAEAYVALGDAADARDMYLRSVEAGVENPNSVPRAEDLVATCLSLCINDVDADEQLRARLDAIYRALGAPW